MRTIHAADLFCGAGGTSTGLRQACEDLGLKVKLVAVNHWDVAINTHSQNHPDAESHCLSLNEADPRQLVPGGKLDLLVASPECTHHSNARGGKPINDQSRASAWRVIEWASQLDVRAILIENVPEFQTWGPLGANGRPLKRMRGALYQSFLNALRAHGYTVETRVLTAADFGDPTSRKRLFIQARKGRKPITWPEPTHAPQARLQEALPLFNAMRPARSLAPYRTAREIIDWSLPSQSIYGRKKPLRPATLQRIFKGLQRFSGWAFLLGNGQPLPVDSPLQAILTKDHPALVQPYLVKFFGGQYAQSVDAPLPTITANYEHYGLAEPFIALLRNGQDSQSLEEPLTTVTTKGAHHALVQPFLVQLDHSKAQTVHGVDKPFPTITTADAMGIAQPFLVKYNGTGGALSLEEPVDTVTAKDRFGLVQPLLGQQVGIAVLDIKFRMLQPHELAAAMSFPKEYFFFGKRAQKVKQIGNAVPVKTAQALCRAILNP